MNLLHSTYKAGIFYFKGQSIPCPSHLQTLLNKTQSQIINIGIRPEFIQVVSAPGEETLTVTVAVVEPLGRETLIRAFLASEPSQALKLITKGIFTPAGGERLSIKPDLSQLTIFDPQTGDRLI